MGVISDLLGQSYLGLLDHLTQLTTPFCFVRSFDTALVVDHVLVLDETPHRDFRRVDEELDCGSGIMEAFEAIVPSSLHPAVLHAALWVFESIDIRPDFLRFDTEHVGVSRLDGRLPWQQRHPQRIRRRDGPRRGDEKAKHDTKSGSERDPNLGLHNVWRHLRFCSPWDP